MTIALPFLSSIFIFGHLNLIRPTNAFIITHIKLSELTSFQLFVSLRSCTNKNSFSLSDFKLAFGSHIQISNLAFRGRVSFKFLQPRLTRHPQVFVWAWDLLNSGLQKEWITAFSHISTSLFQKAIAGQFLLLIILSCSHKNQAILQIRCLNTTPQTILWRLPEGGKEPKVMTPLEWKWRSQSQLLPISKVRKFEFSVCISYTCRYTTFFTELKCMNFYYFPSFYRGETNPPTKEFWGLPSTMSRLQGGSQGPTLDLSRQSKSVSDRGPRSHRWETLNCSISIINWLL